MAELNIVFEDADILLVDKPAGLATQTSKIAEKDLVSVVKNYQKGGYIALINRLDQNVEGLVLFAKTKEGASNLSAQLQNNTIKKIYKAKVYGSLEESASLEDYLVKDSVLNKAKVVDKSTNMAKKAKLKYTVDRKVDTSFGTYSEVTIRLETGRFHQIRVQFSSRGNPILGDVKYGNDISKKLSQELRCNTIALRACSLEFRHPRDNRLCKYEIEK